SKMDSRFRNDGFEFSRFRGTVGHGIPHRFRFFSSFTAKSAARAVSAMYVSDGFWHAADVMHEPSVTNTFGASHTWLCAFSTEVFGSRPMRAVPISWMPIPGK